MIRPPLRRLRTHPGKSRARTQENARHIHIKHGAEIVRCDHVRRLRPQIATGVVEHHVDPAPLIKNRVKRSVHRGLVRHITRQDQRLRMRCGAFPQGVGTPPDQGNAPAFLQKKPCRGASYPAARSGNDRRAIAHAGIGIGPTSLGT